METQRLATCPHCGRPTAHPTLCGVRCEIEAVNARLIANSDALDAILAPNRGEIARMHNGAVRAMMGGDLQTAKRLATSTERMIATLRGGE